MRRLLVAIATVALFAGCGSSQSEGEKACKDFVDAYADLCEKCNPGTYYDCYDGMIDAMGGSCSVVKEVRDVDEFYNVCLPWIRAVDCSDFENLELDDSCVDQLLVENP
jgi:hypothetical protein